MKIVNSSGRMSLINVQLAIKATILAMATVPSVMATVMNVQIYKIA